MKLKIGKAMGFIWLFGIGLWPHASGQIVEWEGCTFLGNVSSGSTPSDWLTYWDQVTAENAGKWGSVEAARDVMNWSGTDIAYNLAINNGLPFKQHVFVWGNQQPSWIVSLPPEEQLEEIEEWIMQFCARYPETDIIEVVNEPLNDPPFSLGTNNDGGNYGLALGGTGTTGYDWIVTAFELAKEHCPNAALWINEYNVLNGQRLNGYLSIIEILKQRNLLDGVGVQAHEFTVFPMTAANIKASLDQLATKNLPIYVTELDIGSGDNSQPINDDVQLEAYQRIFPALWSHPSVHGITLWGYRPGMWRSTAYLVNSNGTERPAMVWLKDYVTQYNSKCENVTSVHDGLREDLKFKVYPNPSQNNRIKVTSDQVISSVLIRDMGGKIIKVVKPELNQHTIEVELNIKQGVYLIEIMGNNTKEIQKLLLE